MKVLHLTPAYKPAYIYGGPTMSVARLCEALHNNNDYLIESSSTSHIPISDANTIEIEVFCTRANGTKELPYPSGKPQIIDDVKVTYFNRLTKDHTHFSPALLWALWKKLSKDKSAYPKGQFLIHIHSWWNLVVLFGALIAKLQGVPIVFSPRGMVTNYTQNNKNSLFKRIIHHSFGKYLLKNMHLLASSLQEQKDYLEICAPLSTHIIPNIVELPDTLPLKSNTESPLYKLLFLSRIEEKKGLELLLSALSKVKFSWSLSIAGAGDASYVEQLKSLINKLKITEKVHWLGHQDNALKYDLIAAHDLLCLTSYNENFANVVVESLAVGTPVLISENVGLSTFVKAHHLGFVCKLDHENIIACLSEAFLKKDLRIGIQNNAPKIIQREFNPGQLAKAYIRVYEDISKLKTNSAK